WSRRAGRPVPKSTDASRATIASSTASGGRIATKARVTLGLLSAAETELVALGIAHHDPRAAAVGYGIATDPGRAQRHEAGGLALDVVDDQVEMHAVLHGLG